MKRVDVHGLAGSLNTFSIAHKEIQDDYDDKPGNARNPERSPPVVMILRVPSAYLGIYQSSTSTHIEMPLP